jgi:hypothetical protein
MSAFTQVSCWEQGLSCVDEQVYAETGAGVDQFVIVVRGASFPAPLAEVLPEVCLYVGGFGLTVTGVHVQAGTAAYIYVRHHAGDVDAPISGPGAEPPTGRAPLP